MADRDPRPDRYEPDDPREWLRLARQDLAFTLASIPGTDAFALHCYHAQQAAEKALKAVCIARGIVFPFTHRLARLLRILSADGAEIPQALRAAAYLTRYAAAGRYPRVSNIDAETLEAAASAASNVVEWAETQIAGAGGVREKPLRRYPHEMRGVPEPAPQLLADIVAHIVAVAAPERIILFGSGARGTLRPGSDLDLMVVTTHEDEAGKVEIAIDDAIAHLDTEIDIVVVTSAELARYGKSIGLVYRPALEEGRVIYAAP